MDVIRRHVSSCVDPTIELWFVNRKHRHDVRGIGLWREYQWMHKYTNYKRMCRVGYFKKCSISNHLSRSAGLCSFVIGPINLTFLYIRVKLKLYDTSLNTGKLKVTESIWNVLTNYIILIYVQYLFTSQSELWSGVYVCSSLRKYILNWTLRYLHTASGNRSLLNDSIYIHNYLLAASEILPAFRASYHYTPLSTITPVVTVSSVMISSPVIVPSATMMVVATSIAAITSAS